jgi:hypothetical protein
MPGPTYRRVRFWYEAPNQQCDFAIDQIETDQPNTAVSDQQGGDSSVNRGQIKDASHDTDATFYIAACARIYWVLSTKVTKLIVKMHD